MTEYNNPPPKSSPHKPHRQRVIVAGMLAQRFAVSRQQARLIAELQGYGAFK